MTVMFCVSCFLLGMLVSISVIAVAPMPKAKKKSIPPCRRNLRQMLCHHEYSEIEYDGKYYCSDYTGMRNGYRIKCKKCGLAHWGNRQYVTSIKRGRVR